MPRTKKARVDQHECALCGKLFDAKRDDAQYCGPRCRQRVSREARARLNQSSSRARKVDVKTKSCRQCGVLSPINAPACCACGVTFTNTKKV